MADELTGTSLMQYLPELYRRKAAEEDGLMEPLLSVFASMFNKLEKTISDIHTYLDPGTTPYKGFLSWLAKWLSLDLYDLWEEKNREFILQAVDYYKKKGTAPGIAEMVKFLTGKQCCVKEYMNNVFRTYGMEHLAGHRNQSAKEKECRTFYHQTSTTVDTTKQEMLDNMGTYEDEVHYTADTSEHSLYNRNVIGLFIFIYAPEKEFKVHEKLHQIIKTFLPVFVRAEVFVVDKIDYRASYPLHWIQEEHYLHIRDHDKESIAAPVGTYINTVNWQWLYTYIDEGSSGITNHLSYRTPHTEIGKEIPI